MKTVQKILTGRGRFALYAAVLLLLVSATALGTWFVAASGAYLSQEGDWQELAGEYRIGIIDYTVEINDETLIEQADQNTVKDYEMLVPLKGGSKMFDGSVTELLRVKEFNEGVTLARVRVVNRSDSTVEVSAVSKMAEQSGENQIRVLPLPVELDAAAVRNLNYRAYVLDTLGVTAADPQTVATVDSKYFAYWNKNPQMVLPMGILPGATKTTPPPGDWFEVAGTYYFYKDVYMVLWSEYADAYNREGQIAPTPWGRLHTTFTVGQLE